MRKVWNIITWVLVAIIVCLAFLLFGFKLFGLQPYTVLSGSMEPTYLTGSLVYVQKVDTNTLKKGDVITFKMGTKTLVTHRIVELVPSDTNGDTIPDTNLFRTKGDNNNTVDGSLVNPKDVVGKVAFGIPLLGYVSAFISSTAGTYCIIGVALILLALLFLPDILFPKKKEKTKSDEGTTNSSLKQSSVEDQINELTTQSDKQFEKTVENNLD